MCIPLNEGLDFMVDESLRVWLLEVNPGPDFKQTGRRLESVVATMLDDSVTVALDRHLALQAQASSPETRPHEAVSSQAEAMAQAKYRAAGTGFKAVYSDVWPLNSPGGSGGGVL